jgi:hypothetical protein
MRRWSATMAFAVACVLSCVLAACSPPQGPETAAAAEPDLHSTSMRIIVVEWRIKRGREEEFRNYWSTQATVADRSGLISEFLSVVENREQFPWMVWELDPRWTTYINVGIWRRGADYQQQIGRFIDRSKPPLDFEAQPRRRVFLAPERWRAGATPFAPVDHPAVR